MDANEIIEDYLVEQDIKIGNKGFTYLKLAIKKCIENPKAIHYVTGLYADIAIDCDTKSTRVERAIRHIITEDTTNKEYIAKCTMMVKRKIVEIEKPTARTAGKVEPK